MSIFGDKKKSEPKVVRQPAAQVTPDPEKEARFRGGFAGQTQLADATDRRLG